MWGKTNSRDKNIEKTVNEILKSRSRSRIYVYLLRQNGAKTEEIIKGTKLHPSTVRETLSKMYSQQLIFRRKMKNDSIGKNPYLYYPIPPIELLKRYANDIEDRLNKLASLTSRKKVRNFKLVKIKINEGADKI
ncbi:MAG: TrmB family transcriptional regulator [Thermoplasmatales archaeon]|jgi:predicted transcriptional regulator|nr:TrmB family transcriptional regulator [Thermoplasmatales archaeon]MCK5636230.1 TrmB family transcriptional regulator [Thermoplasmatales archaeon]